MILRYPKKTNAFAQLVISCLLTAGLLTILSGKASTARIVDPWAVFLTMPKPARAIADLAAFTDPADGHRKLAIATGSGALMLFWDPLTQQLSTAFQTPPDMYTGEPYWLSVRSFKGNLYAGLGNNTNSCLPPPGRNHTGQVWRYDGTRWSLVLSTQHYCTYTLGVYHQRLYAGLGTLGSQSGQLWTSSDGTNWTMLKQFSSSYVRSLAVFKNKLYIGLRMPADLWTYDGTKFVEIGPPPTMTGTQSQLKTLVVSPDHSLLYVGGIPAQIYTWDGSTYKLSLDVTATDTEIYEGTTYKGDILFPTHARQNNTKSGNIYRFSNGSWTLDYSTPPNQGKLQVLRPFQGYIYAGGVGASKGGPPDLLRALAE